MYVAIQGTNAVEFTFINWFYIINTIIYDLLHICGALERMQAHIGRRLKAWMICSLQFGFAFRVRHYSKGK